MGRENRGEAPWRGRCVVLSPSAGPDAIWNDIVDPADGLEMLTISASSPDRLGSWAESFGQARRAFGARPDIVVALGERLAVCASLLRLVHGLAPFGKPPLVVAYDYGTNADRSGLAKRWRRLATAGVYLYVVRAQDERLRHAAELHRDKERFLVHSLPPAAPRGAPAGRGGLSEAARFEFRYLLINLADQKRSGTLLFS